MPDLFVTCNNESIAGLRYGYSLAARRTSKTIRTFSSISFPSQRKAVTLAQFNKPVLMTPVLTRAQRFHLEVNGYVVIPGVIDSTEVTALRDSLIDARRVALEHSHEQRRPVVGPGSRPPNLLKIRSILEAYPAVCRYVTNPKVVAAAEDAVGSEVRLVEVYGICNRRESVEASHNTYRFHRGADPVSGGYVRDGVYYCNFVKALTYLSDVGPEDGGTVIIAGSHKLSLPFAVMVELAKEMPSLVHKVVARSGDTLLQFESVVHATGRISSETERFVMIGGYAASLYPWWDLSPLSDTFLQSLPLESRALFTGRQHWNRPVRGEAHFNEAAS